MRTELETASESSQAAREFRLCSRRSYPEGNRLLLRTQHGDPNARCDVSRVTRPGRQVGIRKGPVSSGSGRTRQSPQNLLAWGGCQTAVTQLQTERQPER